MLSEQVNFTYILHASFVNEPIAVTASINEVPIATANITKNGKFEFLVNCDLEQGPANLSLHVAQTKNSTVTVSAVRLTWVNENSSTDAAWTGREPGPNEIWNYNDPDTEQVLSADNANPKHKTIILDYETDGRKSFLRNYGIVKTNNQEFNLRELLGPYTFKTAGKFSIPMTSPVSYWLMERLFVAI
jgi:hypothetical protein